MTGPIHLAGNEGLSKVAHAIRRSAALYIATMTLPEGTTDKDLFARADSMARWILGDVGGRAATRAAEPAKGSEFMGVNPWEGD